MCKAKGVELQRATRLIKYVKKESSNFLGFFLSSFHQYNRPFRINSTFCQGIVAPLFCTAVAVADLLGLHILVQGGTDLAPHTAAAGHVPASPMPSDHCQHQTPFKKLLRHPFTFSLVLYPLLAINLNTTHLPSSPLLDNHLPLSNYTMAETGLFSDSLVSPEVAASLPPGYRMRALRRSDYRSGFLDCLRVLTTVGDITEEDFEKQYDTMAAQEGYYILVVEDAARTEQAVVATGALVVERKLYVFNDLTFIH